MTIINKLPPPPRKNIMDATAAPRDVLKDKVFYNNGGRQVGEFVLPNQINGVPIKSVLITPSNYISVNEDFGNRSAVKISPEGGEITIYGKFYYMAVFPITPTVRIIGYKYNGAFRQAACVYNSTMVSYSIENNNFYINRSESRLYAKETASFEIFYTD